MAVRRRPHITPTQYRTPEGDYAKVAVDTDHHVLFVVHAKDGTTTEYWYGKQSGKKIIRRLENPFV